jgi:hypothetical protein
MRNRLLPLLCLISGFAAPVDAAPGAQSFPIEAYATPRSVAPGETISFHVSSQVGDYRLEILRDANVKTVVHTSPILHGIRYAIASNAWELGAGWPTSYALQIPADWSSGVYLARLMPVGGDVGERYALFIVRAAPLGSHARLLVVVTTPMYQAYNVWGGKSIYQSDMPGDGKRSFRVSFERPYDANAGTGGYLTRGTRFTHFLDAQGIRADFVDPWDLERDPALADPYELLVTVGADEYVSKAVYDVYEAFRNRGASLAFFGATNTYWRIRYETNGTQMITYKADCDRDPVYASDPSAATCLWGSNELNRPPARLAGVDYVSPSFRGVWSPCRVAVSGHWAFAGTTLHAGDLLGTKLCGGETSATSSASPARVDVLLRTEIPDANDPKLSYRAEAVYYELTPEYGFVNGRGGRVFSAGTEVWADEVLRDPQVAAVTRNVLLHLLAGRPDTHVAALADHDHDGVADLSDNCPLQLNRDQADRDRDGVGDRCDDCTDAYNPRFGTLGFRATRPSVQSAGDQLDADQDGYGNACDGDLNEDGIVSFADLARLKAVFFTADPFADLNGDGVVNFSDLAILKKGLFARPGASP